MRTLSSVTSTARCGRHSNDSIVQTSEVQAVDDRIHVYAVQPAKVAFRVVTAPARELVTNLCSYQQTLTVNAPAVTAKSSRVRDRPMPFLSITCRSAGRSALEQENRHYGGCDYPRGCSGARH